MSEKKGFTGQLKCDFITAANLEIYMPNTTYGWYRVTSREFRSFNGERRINEVPYNGPVYLFGTNSKVNSLKYPKDKLTGYNYKPSYRGNETSAY